MMRIYKKITIQDLDRGITLVKFKDDIIWFDLIIEKLSEELFSLVKEQRKNKILLNWKNVKFYNTNGLPMLIIFRRMVEEVGGKLVFCLVRREVLENLILIKPWKRFNIEKDLNAGVSVFD
ncbi:MAG: hypothetical protein EXS48_00370 [Candidatus Staskawiczbacteria bacterium]|nr:hypothetical protein [Candidatus Staskawiczbacteria bacterium]